MRFIRRIPLVVMALLLSFGGAGAQDLSCVVMGDPAGRPSPLEQVSFTFEGVDGLLCYGAPSVRGREIWGGLVPYGQPWRAGANEPTTLHISGALTLGGIDLEPGSYSIYAIPNEDEWEFFVNSNYNRWGIPITAEVRSTELGSFTVAPRGSDEMTEVLVWEHMTDHLMLTWESLHFHLPLSR